MKDITDTKEPGMTSKPFAVLDEVERKICSASAASFHHPPEFHLCAGSIGSRDTAVVKCSRNPESQKSGNGETGLESPGNRAGLKYSPSQLQRRALERPGKLFAGMRLQPGMPDAAG